MNEGLFPDTYRDGVGVERCNLCGHAMRGRDDAPLVTVREDDLEVVLGELRNTPGVWLTPELVRRLEQAIGFGRRQLEARSQEAGYGHGV